MNNIWCYFTLLLVTMLSQMDLANCSSCTFCDDWTLCQRVRCAAPPDPCPKETPYLLYGECGCCQFCSETPRVGPCGTCGVDVVCKEEYPICREDQIVSLDYCGCCRVCKTVIALGGNCTTKGPSFSVCAAGLRCIKGKCSEPVVV